MNTLDWSARTQDFEERVDFRSANTVLVFRLLKGRMPDSMRGAIIAMNRGAEMPWKDWRFRRDKSNEGGGLLRRLVCQGPAGEMVTLRLDRQAEVPITLVRDLRRMAGTSPAPLERKTRTAKILMPLEVA